MVPTLLPDQVRRLRTRAQQLTPADQAADVAEVVQACGGMQAQEAPAAALAVRARSRGLTAAAVEAARVEGRTVVRTWAMRGTLHLVATADLGWLLPLLGPPFIQGSHRRRLELGLDDATCARAIPLLCDVLAARGPLTRAEIVAHLAGHGIRLEGQAAPHLLGRAALEGWICYGPNRGKEPTYALLTDWVALGPALPPEEAAAELVRRCLAAFGPARPDDWAAWSGLPLKDGRAAWARIRDELIEVVVEDRPAWLLHTQQAWLDEPPPSAPVVRLLGGYDTYLLGYRTRDGMLDPAHARRIHPGGGIIHPALLVDGMVAGTWRLHRRRAGVEIAVTPFTPLAPTMRPALDAEAADVARFLGQPGTLLVTDET
jgi:hypothetical protein